jgi:ABC-type histidine transport system ATPase subunit
MGENNNIVVRLEGISKRFGSSYAVRGVTLALRCSGVMGLVGLALVDKFYLLRGKSFLGRNTYRAAHSRSKALFV